MQKSTLFALLVIAVAVMFVFLHQSTKSKIRQTSRNEVVDMQAHWFLLNRKEHKEYFFYGMPGDRAKSDLLRTFEVKAGIAGEKPTPLPQLVGREYWTIVDKLDAHNNPDTAPYFLVLDVPGGDVAPYGPAPYLECDGQCNWEKPGYFGLHGTAGDPTKLAASVSGSSGCVRHRDEDIEFLYKLLDPKNEEIRYYVI